MQLTSIPGVCSAILARRTHNLQKCLQPERCGAGRERTGTHPHCHKHNALASTSTANIRRQHQRWSPTCSWRSSSEESTTDEETSSRRSQQDPGLQHQEAKDGVTSDDYTPTRTDC
ncbi:unnamed protein product [Arctogadus glacialis]